MRTARVDYGKCGEAEVEDPLYFLTASILDMICRYGSVQQVLPGSFHTGSYLRKRSTAGRRLAFCCMGRACGGRDGVCIGRHVDSVMSQETVGCVSRQTASCLRRQWAL